VATAQPGPAGDAVTEEAADSLPNAPPTVVTAQPGSAGDTVAQGAIPRLNAPASCDLSIDRTERDVVSPPDAGRSSPVEVHRSPESAMGEPPELTYRATRLDPLPNAPEPVRLPMVTTIAPVPDTKEPDLLPIPPEPSTGIDDQKISPVEELAQGFTAVTLIVTDRPPDQLLERPKTPRAFGDEDRRATT